MKNVVFSPKIWEAENLQSEDPKRILFAFFETAIQSGLPVSVWKLPETDECFAIIDVSLKPQKQKTNLSECEPGFIFAPFKQ